MHVIISIFIFLVVIDPLLNFDCKPYKMNVKKPNTEEISKNEYVQIQMILIQNLIMPQCDDLLCNVIKEFQICFLQIGTAKKKKFITYLE